MASGLDTEAAQRARWAGFRPLTWERDKARDFMPAHMPGGWPWFRGCPAERTDGPSSLKNLRPLRGACGVLDPGDLYRPSGQ